MTIPMVFFLFPEILAMNVTEEGECDSDCLDHWAGFWIEGVVLPIIAALGIAGAEKCWYCVSARQKRQKLIRGPWGTQAVSESMACHW